MDIFSAPQIVREPMILFGECLVFCPPGFCWVFMCHVNTGSITPPTPPWPRIDLKCTNPLNIQSSINMRTTMVLRFRGNSGVEGIWWNQHTALTWVFWESPDVVNSGPFKRTSLPSRMLCMVHKHEMAWTWYFLAGVLKYDTTTQRVIWGKSYYLELQDAGDAVSELTFWERIFLKKRVVIWAVFKNALCFFHAFPMLCPVAESWNSKSLWFLWVSTSVEPPLALVIHQNEALYGCAKQRLAVTEMDEWWISPGHRLYDVLLRLLYSIQMTLQRQNTCLMHS